MAGAETFFIKDTASNEEADSQEIYFEEHITDEQLLKEGLEKGVFFKGSLRTNPLYVHRGFITLEGGIDVDFMVRGFNHLNRAIDGDTVIVQLFPPNQWPEKTYMNQNGAKVAATDLKTGLKTSGIA